MWGGWLAHFFVAGQTAARAVADGVAALAIAAVTLSCFDPEVLSDVTAPLCPWAFVGAAAEVWTAGTVSGRKARPSQPCD